MSVTGLRSPTRSPDVASIVLFMTPHGIPKPEVGIRELHNQLSRYVRYVADGGEVTVTMRGKHVARLTPVGQEDPLKDLRRRGLVSEPVRTWAPPHNRPKPNASVSDLVAEQRR